MICKINTVKPSAVDMESEVPHGSLKCPDHCVVPFQRYNLHNNTLSRRPTTTMRSNDTLGNAPFQLISDFFHVNKVLSVLSMLSKLPPGVYWGGGGGGGSRLAK